MIIIGVIEFAQKRDTPHIKWSRVRPIYRAQGDNWVPIPETLRKNEFPNAGLVFWPKPPQIAEKGTVWTVELNEKSHGDSQGKVANAQLDQFEVAKYDRPLLLTTMERGSDATDLRRRCATGAFSFKAPPPASFAVAFPGKPDHWVGPIDPKFEKGSDSRWIGHLTTSPGFLDVHRIKPGDITPIDIEGFHCHVLRPTAGAGQVVEEFCAQSDDNLLSTVLKRLRALDSEAAKALGLTNNLLRNYSRVLENAGAIGSELDLHEVQRGKAVEWLVARLDSDAEFLSKVSDSLLGHPAVRPELDKAIAAEIKKRTTAIEREAAEKTAQVSEKLDADHAELERTETRLNSCTETLGNLQDEIDRRKASLNELTDQIETNLKGAVARILKDPIEKLSEQAVVQALLSQNLTSDVQAAEPALTTDEPGHDIAELDTMLGALRIGSKLLGFDPAVAFRCLASLLGGRVTLLSGVRASAITELVGRVISGKNRRAVHVSSQVFSLDDLLNAPAIATHADLDTAALGQVLGRLSDVDHITTVTLHGVNRSPLETAFGDLTENRSLPTARCAIPWRSEIDPKHVKPLTASPNVLLMGTLVGGSSVFKIPYDLRQRVALVWTDAPATDQSTVPNLPIEEYSVQASRWHQWTSETPELSEQQTAAISKVPPGANCTSETHREIAAFRLVFRTDDCAFGEWLVTRFGGILDHQTLLTLANRFGNQVGDAIATAQESGTLEHHLSLIESQERA